MSSEKLSGEELAAMVQRVFEPTAEDKALAIMVDLPDEQVPDNPEWAERRAMAAGWAQALTEQREALGGMAVRLFLYRNAHRNNADLPEQAHMHASGLPLPANFEAIDPAVSPAMLFARLLAQHAIVLAPTHFSATAPLKLATADHAFRAATMPGFSAAMIPALRLDYGEVNRRVDLCAGLLTRAEGASFTFEVDGQRQHELHLDLRHRSAHASGGLFPRAGVAGNLPSGEAYIVPYEGEVEGDPSRSAGEMPVQLGLEVVVHTIVENRSTGVTGEGEAAIQEAAALKAEPAYGNLAELGLGVLGDFGLAPTGEILLDEKLGPHIAFGRSDHFGGQVGNKDFSGPDAVVHIDRVYTDSMQPRVRIVKADLHLPGGVDKPLMRDNEYVLGF